MVCTDECPLALGSHAKIVAVEERGCNHKHTIRQLLPQVDFPGVRRCFAYYGCQINEARSMAQRHMIEIPPTTSEMLVLFRAALTVLVKDLPPKPLEPLHPNEVLERMTGPKRRVAEQAFQEYSDRGWDPKAARVSAFVKFEKGADDLGDPAELKAPRLIQHRKPMYIYELARYIRPIEDYCFHSRGGRPSNRPWTTKGMDSFQCGERVASMDRWDDTVWVLLDHSRYDSTLRHELREVVEWAYYRKFYKNDGWFKELLKMQRKNRGRTSEGISYEVLGTMLSGEYNTSCGDTLINYALIRLWVGPEADIIANGDDSVVAMPRWVFESLDMDFFAKVGLRTKMQVVYSIHDVDYCQCKPVRVDGRWRMVRDPIRVFTRMPYTTKDLTGKAWAGLAWAMGMSENSCNTGVPMMQAFAQRVLECNPAEHWRILDQVVRESMRNEKLTSGVIDITSEARLDFWLSFGFSPDQQISFESWISEQNLCALPQ